MAAPLVQGETLETARDQVRQTVVQSWGRLEAAKSNIAATHAQEAA